jgi:hypothetical protein
MSCRNHAERLTGHGSDLHEVRALAKDRSIDEAKLQSHVMSFADRFYSIMASGFTEYIALKPSKKNRYEVQRMVTYSVSQAYIIAAEEHPRFALLDVLSMVLLGRIIFEEEGMKR